MINLLQERTIGDFSLNKVTLTKEIVEFAKFRARFHGDYYEVFDLKPGTYMRLMHNREIIMSNTPMEIRTTKEIIDKANGKVLLAGLGIGLIILPIQEKNNVKSVIIIEKHKEVIDLVADQLPLNKKIRIIHADIFEWLPEEREKFDTIYFDIWSGICSDNYEETKALHKRFRKYLNYKNPDRYMNSWRREDFERLYFADKK